MPHYENCREVKVGVNYVFPASSVGIIFLGQAVTVLHALYYQQKKKLQRRCHVDITTKGRCFSRVGRSGSEGDRGRYYRKHEVNCHVDGTTSP